MFLLCLISHLQLKCLLNHNKVPNLTLSTEGFTFTYTHITHTLLPHIHYIRTVVMLMVCFQVSLELDVLKCKTDLFPHPSSFERKFERKAADNICAITQ